MAISTTHARIVAACAAGEWADLSGLPDDEREVEASFIRVLMLGLRQNGAPVARRLAAFPATGPLRPAAKRPHRSSSLRPASGSRAHVFWGRWI